MNDQQGFDILDYLNDMYVMNLSQQIDVKHAGGHFNRFGDGNNVDKEILEINKKRIHIPNARIKPFSVRQEEDFGEYNETQSDTITTKSTKQSRKRSDETSDEDEQEGSFGGPLAKEVVEI